jgi:Putative RNA methylase family UPF0020
MSKAAATLLGLTPAEELAAREATAPEPHSDAYVREMAREFCEERPYAELPYSKRNWGGRLHSLCSYQGKLKPSIAHFLVAWFTSRGQTVLDPMAGVGTIPLEARLQGRRAYAGDLSELAVAVSRAKLERIDGAAAFSVVDKLADFLDGNAQLSDETLIAEEDATFGLNGKIVDYFHETTLREVLLARRFFREATNRSSAEVAVVETAVLHILHGNRPYALSRRSHPVTPLKPTGAAEYRSLSSHVRARLEQTLPLLAQLGTAGAVFRADFAKLPLGVDSVDAVITSPPFTQSLRFFSSNWMRLWFCGWPASAFRDCTSDYLEREQRHNFDHAYRRFLASVHRLLRPGGLLIMHVGATRRLDMAVKIAPLLRPGFELLHRGVEQLDAPESHGLSDKGATTQHAFLFCRALK